MGYRSKSPARILGEIDALAHRYEEPVIWAPSTISSIIVTSMACSASWRRSKDYEFFYEVKANLRREQLRVLAAGGIRRIQPGIESLNTDILKVDA